ncbi:MAG: hypothetical protein JW801_14740 [Bacteroidales bacterium]|nr:hypothetical protein [Bacteroidales bacterium]
MKKNILVTVVLLILIVTAIISLVNRKSGTVNEDKTIFDDKTIYIEGCINTLKGLKLTEEQEITTCNCSHDYLFNKYGDKIYSDTFIVTSRVDSLALIKCMLITMKVDTANSEAILRQLNMQR